MLLSLHILAGGLAIVLGGLALTVKKGGTLHRASGIGFVAAMLVMGGSASVLAFLRSPTDPQIRAGLLTAYLVVTALATVRPPSRWTRIVTACGSIVALVLGVFGLVGAYQIFQLPRRVHEGVPFFVPLLLGVVLLLAAGGDLRVLRSGPLRGAPRLKRHLWRMCFALFIAAGSFFSIRERVAKVLPEPFANGWMRALPILLIFGAMFFWLWRLRRRSPLHEPGVGVPERFR
jgi:hypothetical protein